jgi:RNA polymerase sigma-70 factor, ECF subfamily
VVHQRGTEADPHAQTPPPAKRSCRVTLGVTLLSQAFLLALPNPLREEWRSFADLEASLQNKWLAVQDELPALLFPDVAAAQGQLVALLARSVSRDKLDVAALFAADLFLSARALLDEKAQHYLEQHVLAPLQRQLVGKVGEASAQETIQRVRITLYLSTDRRSAKLETYSGRAPLRGWLSLLVHREWIDSGRRTQAAMAETPLEAEQASRDLALVDPNDAGAELQAVRSQHRSAFTAALSTVARSLPSEDRKVLLRVAQGASVDDIGTELQVHRSTAARMVARAKQKLLLGVQGELRRTLRAGDASVDRICASLYGEVEETLGGMLASLRVGSP